MDVFFSGLLDGIDAMLNTAGAVLDLLIVATPQEELAALAQWAQAGDVEGVVLADLSEGDSRPARCRELGLRAVLVGVNNHPDFGGVSVDNDGAMRLALSYLLGLGHRSIGRVSGPHRLQHTKARDDAFVAELAAAGGVGSVLEGDYGETSGFEATSRFLEASPRPTAIVYDNDVMAAAGIEAAAAAGLRVPEDLSILAWDDSAISRLAEPPLSVVSRDVRKLGVLVATALLADQTGDPPRLELRSDAQVVARASTAPAPTAT